MLLFGATFAIVTPPFQAPDETEHFDRAYRVSEGRLDLLPVPVRTAAPLPVSVHRIGEVFGDLPFHPERRTSPRAILAALRIPLAPERREPVSFPGSLNYTCVPYLPQAIGIAAGRLFGAPALALLYLARLTNLLCGALAVAFAVRRLPAFAWLAAMVALTPMALSLLGSASADVTTLASSFVLVATVAKLAWGTEEATLVLPAAWIFHSRRWAARAEPGRLGMALGAFSLVSWGIAVWVLVGRYYGV
jgi:hypothetical protein